MIEEYYRPTNLKEALRLLEKDPSTTFPLGGGNGLSQETEGKIKVVDLQLLQLDKISIKETGIAIGACVTLQQIVEHEQLPTALKDAAEREGAINLRRSASLAGSLVSGRGQSPIGAVLMAMDAVIVVEPGESVIGISEWIPTVKGKTPARLIVRIEIPAGGTASYIDIRKTPADMPIIFSSMSLSDQGVYRWVIGLNQGKSLFMETGKNPSSFLENAHSHFNKQTQIDFYTINMLDVLHRRLLLTISANGRDK